MSLDLEDWKRWVKGLVGAGISGTASAISSGISTTLVAPDKFNIQDGIGNLVKVISITAIVSFVVSISKYLSTKPLPEDE